MFDKSTIDFYNLYVTDSWHIKPTLTLTYGLGYQVEMPPVEQNGKQVELVDRLRQTDQFHRLLILQDADPTQLAEWTPKLVDKLRTLPQLSDVASDISAQGLSVFVEIDRDQAARFGITPATIDNALYDSYGQRIVSTIFTNSNQYRVILEADPSLQTSLQALSAIYLPSSVGGTPVPLAVMAKMREETAPLQVSHLGQFPSATVSFNLAPGAALGDAVTAIQQAQIEIGQPLGVITSFQGAALAFQSSLSNQLFLILAAIVTVYIVLGVLYESFIHPVTILSTLPSAGIGALLALMVAGDDLTIVAIIGIILLIGIVKKNAIMMIDFALDAERNEGKPPREAIYQACLLRFRPIVMTTMAAVLGALPLMIGTGAGSELRHPLGISIVGGLLVSQLLTLFTTPVIYLWFDRLALRFAGRSGTCRPGERVELSHGSVNTLHSPAGRNDVADLRARGGGCRGVFQAAGLAAAAGGFPDHFGAGDAAGREPAGCRHHGRQSAGTPSRADRRRDRDDLLEHGRKHAHHAAVRVEPGYQRRRPRRAGGDQRGARRPSDQPAFQSDLPQGQSSRRADPGPDVDVRHADARRSL